ncbi:hypothetical protein GVAV_001127 [Gurleya vavrai]
MQHSWNMKSNHNIFIFLLLKIFKLHPISIANPSTYDILPAFTIPNFDFHEKINLITNLDESIILKNLEQGKMKFENNQESEEKNFFDITTNLYDDSKFLNMQNHDLIFKNQRSQKENFFSRLKRDINDDIQKDTLDYLDLKIELENFYVVKKLRSKDRSLYAHLILKFILKFKTEINEFNFEMLSDQNPDTDLETAIISLNKIFSLMNHIEDIRKNIKFTENKIKNFITVLSMVSDLEIREDLSIYIASLHTRIKDHRKDIEDIKKRIKFREGRYKYYLNFYFRKLKNGKKIQQRA